MQLLLQHFPSEFNVIAYKQVVHWYNPLDSVHFEQVEGQHVLFVISRLYPVLHLEQTNAALHVMQFTGQHIPVGGIVLSEPKIKKVTFYYFLYFIHNVQAIWLFSTIHVLQYLGQHNFED